jgi:hypothetical protein
LAVAGNEQALLYLNDALDLHRDTINTAVQGQTGELAALVAAAALPFLQASLTGQYPREREFTVGIEITSPNESTVSDTYRAATAVTPSGNRFRVETEVYRVPDGGVSLMAPPVPAMVRAYVEFRVISLDDYALTMVQSMRITN